MEPWVGVYGVVLLGLATNVILLRNKPFKSRDFDGEDSVAKASSSPVIPNWLLGGYRLSVFIFALILGLWQVVFKGTFHLRFFTIWNWWLLVLYFGCATLITYGHAPVWAQRWGRELDKRRPLARYCTVLFSINLTTVVLVDVVTWFVLFPMLIKNSTTQTQIDMYNTMFLNFTSYNQHGVNAVFMLIELLCNSLELQVYMLGYVGTWSLTYSVWALSFHAATGVWLYPFLDTSKPWAPLAYLGLYVAHLTFFGGVLVLHRIKCAIFGKVHAPSVDMAMDKKA